MPVHWRLRRPRWPFPPSKAVAPFAPSAEDRTQKRRQMGGVSAFPFLVRIAGRTGRSGSARCCVPQVISRGRTATLAPGNAGPPKSYGRGKILPGRSFTDVLVDRRQTVLGTSRAAVKRLAMDWKIPCRFKLGLLPDVQAPRLGKQWRQSRSRTRCWLLPASPHRA